MKALLTLVLFLVSTTIFAQSWLDKNCPELDQDINSIEFESAKKRNILDILINQSDEIIVNGEERPGLNSEIKFKEFVLDFVTNPNQDKNKAENPSKVYFRLTSYNKTSTKLSKLDTYIKEVYLYLWDKEGQSKYESTYANLNCKKRDKIFRDMPLQLVSENSSNQIQNKQPNKRIGLPPFGGDVKQ